MEKEKIQGKDTDILKIELNSAGEYIAIPADSPVFYDGFVAGYRHITNLAESIPSKLEEIEKRYEGKEEFSAVMDKTLEMSRVNVEFSEEAVKTIDRIFGDGTVKKFFRSTYDEVPNFLPDSDCIMDFFEQIIPVMERLFDRKIERQQKASKARMAKYQPQDHKRKGSK